MYEFFKASCFVTSETDSMEVKKTSTSIFFKSCGSESEEMN